MSFQPPKWPLKFLRWFCRTEYIDEIEGDIHELFHERARKSRRLAVIFLYWNVFRSIRWENLKKGKTIQLGLYKNYFKVGFRSLVKDRKFTIINLFGLSLGLAVFLTIILMIRHELSFDKFHSKADRLYQVIQMYQNADGDDPEIWTSWQLAGALKKDIDIVENAVTIHGASSTWAQAGGKKFFEEEGIVAGDQFFEMFDFKLKNGNPEKVLEAKKSIVLTQSLAAKYFGFDNPIGKVVDLEFYGSFTVTGVLEDIPANSYLQFEFVISQDYDVFLQTVSENFRRSFYSWTGDHAATYVLLKNSKDRELFESKVSVMLEKYLPKEDVNRHYLLGMLDLHFNSHGIDGRVNQYVKGDFYKVKFLAIVGVIILVMACFNYISISTARYIKRTKEVGVRKAMGAHRKQVAMQFLIESFLLVLVSFMVGLVLTKFLLPYFYSITGINLGFCLAFLLESMPYFIGVILLVTIVAGFYPAFHLSRYSVINVIKRITVSSTSADTLRKFLVSVQYLFLVSILAGLVIVNQQYRFINGKFLGFNTEQLVIVEINSAPVRNNFRKIKSELTQLPDVESVTGLTRMISGYRSGAAVELSLADKPDESNPAKYYGMDEDGLATLKLDLLSGQGFSGIRAKDSISVVINETAAQLYGGQEAIGKFVKIEETNGNKLRAMVVGIVNDFHHRSLRKTIGPVIIGYYKNPIVSLDDIVIKLSGLNTPSTLEQVEQIHNRFDTNGIMTWEFMDDMVQQEYEDEATFRSVFFGASILSFCIAILGMIGLASYNINSRKKEIAIRRILGAEFGSLMKQYVKEFVILLVGSSLISIPLCWWLASEWLINFEYRVEVSPFAFLAVIMVVLVITCLVVLAVGTKTIKTNPVESIRYE